MTNKYGVDVAYFKQELSNLVNSLKSRTPEELRRYLLRLADVAMKPDKQADAPRMPDDCGVCKARELCCKRYPPTFFVPKGSDQCKEVQWDHFTGSFND